MLTENVTVYRFSGAGPLAGLLAPEGAGAEHFWFGVIAASIAFGLACPSTAQYNSA